MKIIPAIDLMNGKVVRLIRGDPETLKVYKHFGDPITVARKWESEGADKRPLGGLVVSWPPERMAEGQKQEGGQAKG